MKELLVGKTIETQIHMREDLLRGGGQGSEARSQMARDLLPVRPVSVAQLALDVFSRLGYKSEDRLVTLLAFIFRL